MDNAIQEHMRQYYSEKFRQAGPTSKGVDWNTTEAQHLRFEQLLKILPVENQKEQWRNCSIVDFGSGYGALLQYMRENLIESEYVGVDCVAEMIEAGSKLFMNDQKSRFLLSADPDIECDYAIACGIFNTRGNFSDKDWLEHIETTLHLLNRISKSGFTFNILTSYSDTERMREDLYYADPCYFFDFCKRNFSKNIALLHDYGAYEFTILVRKA